MSRWQDSLVGWKIGYIPADHRTAGDPDRLVGPIWRQQYHQSEEQVSAAEVGIFASGFAAVEAELVIRLGQDLPSHDGGYWTAEEVADLLEIHISTFYRWRSTHEDFADACVTGKHRADEHVVGSRHQRACGYDYTAERLFMPAHAPDPIVGRYVYVQCEGKTYRTYYEEHGEGIPLVCLHTAGTDGRQYRHQL